MEIDTTVPCAPIGTAAISDATNIASRMKNRTLNAVQVYYLSNIYINQKQYNIVVDKILYLVRDG
jgi:hypothetical protein